MVLTDLAFLLGSHIANLMANALENRTNRMVLTLVIMVGFTALVVCYLQVLVWFELLAIVVLMASYMSS